MKSVPASALAMIAGWLAPLVGLALWQLAERGATEDISFMAIWSGLFIFASWLVFVLPLLGLFPGAAWLHDARWSWLSWLTLALVAYLALVVSWLGRGLLEILWYPALTGLVAGATFGWLTRRKDSP